jgi:hypothetical protein
VAADSPARGHSPARGPWPPLPGIGDEKVPGGATSSSSSSSTTTAQGLGACSALDGEGGAVGGWSRAARFGEDEGIRWLDWRLVRGVV